MNTKYGYIIEDLRKNVFEEVVNELFKTAEVSIPKIDEETDSRDECAKAFLIWLAISRFGISIESDIVLCHMGLLKGFSIALSFVLLRPRNIHYNKFSIKLSSVLKGCV